MDDAIKPPDRLSETPRTSTASPSDEVDWTGQVLGEFRLLNRLGRGGMGQVYLAEQTSLKRKVALKLLNPDLASNERSLLRFKAEAENVARATHANIVQIYTIGQASGVNYLALEYVEGRNLREFIEKKGTPELPFGLQVMAQVAAALQRASELGIIHRDIKPENILLTKKGEVKVADFGLSRCFAEETQQSLTQSQITMGTPLYMSPEQVERGPVDRRTDIYSFGVTCYHMFAGTPPFRGTSPLEVAYQHVHKEPQLLSEIRPDLPAELCAIIQKMMAKKPEERYQSAGEIVRDINHLCEVLNLGAIGAVSISSSFIGGTSDALKNAASRTVPISPFRSRAGICGSVLLALAIGLAFGWYHTHRNAPTKDPLPIQPSDDPSLLKKPLKPHADEKALRQLVEKYLSPENHPQAMTGLQHSVELGLFYIHEKRFDEADTFFLELRQPERNVPAFAFLGNLGHAIVLAFKDDYAASNKEFLIIAADIERIESRLGVKLAKKDVAVLKSKIEAYKYLWKDHPPVLRELAAQALNRNFVNNPAEFPAEKLDLYRFPPRPTLKAFLPVTTP